MTAPKFLQRIHFSPRVKPGGARPAIVQYHPQAAGELAKRQGYVLAFLEPWAAEHGASLAAGPDALDLLDRIVSAFNAGEISLRGGAQGLVGEALRLVARAIPPVGSVHPNGTPCTPAERAPADHPDNDYTCDGCGKHGTQCTCNEG